MKGVKKKQQAFIFRAYKVPERERASAHILFAGALSLSAHAELEIEAADRPNQLNSSTPFHLQQAHAGWLTDWVLTLTRTHTQA